MRSLAESARNGITGSLKRRQEERKEISLRINK
jgi:hypothetical protein